MNLEARLLNPEGKNPGINLTSKEELLVNQHDRVVGYLKDFFKEKYSCEIKRWEKVHNESRTSIEDCYFIHYFSAGKKYEKGSIWLISLGKASDGRKQYKFAADAEYACGTISNNEKATVMFFVKGDDSKEGGQTKMRDLFLEYLTLHGYAKEIIKK